MAPKGDRKRIMLKKMKYNQFDAVYHIMEISFPVDEHRPYEEQKALLDRSEYQIYVMNEEKSENVMAFLAVWDLGPIIFVEHFAVNSQYRNGGIGTKMLQEMKSMAGKTLCLEVELPEEELAKRRIEFYERNGFYLNEYPYMQPSLSEGQAEIPLFIMTTKRKVDEREFQSIKSLLYEKVYGRKEQSGCRLCPRECGRDRKHGKVGYCGVTGTKIMGARAALHMWEEPCISGEEGAGAVFFSGCPLRCVYCQNYDIAHVKRGTEISVERLAEIFLKLQEKRANNINLVTPTHYSVEIIRAVQIAKEKGLRIPIVYNCSGYEKVDTLKKLDGIVDIYLTDFKYMDEEIAARYSNAKDYPEVAKAALHEMVRQCGQPEFDERGIMTRGVIVRHLLLPGFVQNGKDIVNYLHETYGESIFVSLMNQYTPLPHVAAYPEINRKVTAEEYDELVDYAIEIGVENGFIQEGETAKESFIPDFDNEGWG